MTEKFARLEDTDHGQALLTIQNSDNGPTVTLRISERHGIEPAITMGPWEDSDEGWKLATNAFLEMTLSKGAEDLAKTIDSILKQ